MDYPVEEAHGVEIMYMPLKDYLELLDRIKELECDLNKTKKIAKEEFGKRHQIRNWWRKHVKVDDEGHLYTISTSLEELRKILADPEWRMGLKDKPPWDNLDEF